MERIPKKIIRYYVKEIIEDYYKKYLSSVGNNDIYIKGKSKLISDIIGYIYNKGHKFPGTLDESKKIIEEDIKNYFNRPENRENSLEKIIYFSIVNKVGSIKDGEKYDEKSLCHSKIINYMREKGHLLWKEYEIECKDDILSVVSVKSEVRGALIPKISSIDDLLYILPSFSKSLKDKLCEKIENNKKISWLNGEAYDVSKEYCADQCSILKYYKIIDKDFYKHLSAFKDLEKYIGNEIISLRPTAPYFEYDKLWFIVGKKTASISAANDLLKLKDINNNISFWYSIYKECMK